MTKKCVYSMSAFLDYASIDLSEGTLLSYKSAIKLFFEFFKEHPLLLQINDVQSYVSYLKNRKLSASIISVRLSALNCYYEYLRKQKICTLDFSIMKDVKRPKIIMTEQLVVQSEEVSELIQKLESKKNILFTDLRDTLMILIAVTTGARVHEINNLKVEHISVKNNSITFYTTKNKKPRVLFLSEIVHKRLEHYLTEREKILKSYKGRQRLLFITKSCSHVRLNHLTRKMKSYEKKYKIKITWHSIRRGFATDLANNGVELEKISKMLGHSSVDITASRYIYSNIKNNVIFIISSNILT